MLRNIYDVIHRAMRAVDSSFPSNEKLNENCDEVSTMRDQIADGPAETFDDLLVKLMEFEYVLQERCLDTDWHEPLPRTAREGMERLTREAAS